MLKLSSTKSYALITGTILFLLGLLGFAFTGSFNLPWQYLFFSLILGFWGIVISVAKKQ
jgi:hypothetical protein